MRSLRFGERECPQHPGQIIEAGYTRCEWCHRDARLAEQAQGAVDLLDVLLCVVGQNEFNLQQVQAMPDAPEGVRKACSEALAAADTLKGALLRARGTAGNWRGVVIGTMRAEERAKREGA